MIIQLIRKPKGFSLIRVILFNIPLIKRINPCIRGKTFAQIKEQVCLDNKPSEFCF